MFLNGHLSIEAADTTDVALLGDLERWKNYYPDRGHVSGDQVSQLALLDTFFTCAASIDLQGIAYQAGSDILLSSATGDIVISAQLTSLSGTITIDSAGSLLQESAISITVGRRPRGSFNLRAAGRRSLQMSAIATTATQGATSGTRPPNICGSARWMLKPEPL